MKEEKTIPRYLRSIGTYTGAHRTLKTGEYFDTLSLNDLTSFSKYTTWERLKSECNFTSHFAESSEEEYNKAKGIVPVINNTFPIY